MGEPDLAPAPKRKVEEEEREVKKIKLSEDGSSDENEHKSEEGSIINSLRIVKGRD